ncbi:MAG: ankyrin repeat domain-containing protein [Acidobacteria bacterium]|nr:ankyrin repeat domain-containing protein [Acidobacteriota bacterium]
MKSSSRISGILLSVGGLLLLAASSLYAASDLQLFDAVRRQDMDAVRVLLDQKPDVNARQGDGATALHWAAHRDDLEVAELLIGAGADVNAANEYGVTALALACTNQNEALVEKLLLAGADANLAQLSGVTPLMECSRTGSGAAVKLLLDRGASVDARESKSGQTALMWAASGGHSTAVKHLIDHKADVRLRSKGGFTPLLFAARSGNVASARLLFEAGADANDSTEEYGSALVVAAAGGHEDLGIFLLEKGANPNAADRNGITALHQAARNGLEAFTGVRYDPSYRIRPPNMPLLAKALLSRGANPNLQIAKNVSRGPDGSPFLMRGATAYFLAAASGDAMLMRILREGGASATLTAEAGITPLMAAARSACTGSCAFQGANEIDEAEAKAALEAVMAAVESGADVNTLNEDGQTALHMAAFTGADGVVEYLASKGAKVDVTDKHGETPWSMAAGISPVLRYRGLYGKHESTATLLEKLGAVPITRQGMDEHAPAPPGQ